MKMPLAIVPILLFAAHVALAEPNENATRNVFGRSSSPATSMFNLRVSPTSMVTVRFLQRNLTGDVGGVVRRATDGTVSHVQIVAYDESGRIIDNFGLTGEGMSPSLQKSKIEIEKKSDILKKYNPEPLGERKMSAEAYVRARDRTEQMALYYAPLNNVPLDAAVTVGASAGALAAGTMGALAGGAVAAKVAVDQYDQHGRHNLAVASDDLRQMSFAGMNCHYLPVLFEQNSDAEPTLVIVKPYSQPGEVTPTSIAGLETPASSSDVVNAGRLAAPGPTQTVQTSSGTANTAHAYQTQTTANTVAKGQMSNMPEGASQHASGIAAEAGPAQQTSMGPSGSTSSEGYSSEIMDQVGRTFAEQGPCSAGFMLEALKNQNQNP